MEYGTFVGSVGRETADLQRRYTCPPMAVLLMRPRLCHSFPW